MKPTRLSLPPALREYHQQQLARRTAGQTPRAAWELLLADVNAIADRVLLPA